MRVIWGYYTAFLFFAFGGPEGPGRAQGSPERPREGPGRPGEGPGEAQGSPERPREGQERPGEAQGGPGKPREARESPGKACMQGPGRPKEARGRFRPRNAPKAPEISHPVPI